MEASAYIYSKYEKLQFLKGTVNPKRTFCHHLLTLSLSGEHIGIYLEDCL